MTSSNAMVVVIGAARSGTKLLRDLLAEHPSVGRIPWDVNFIWRMGNEAVPHDELDPSTVTPGMRRKIRRSLDRMAVGGPVIVEKTVSNCLRVAFVQEIVSEARFIHLVRDGRDVVESAIRQWEAKPDPRYLFRKLLDFPMTSAFPYAVKYGWRTLRRMLPGGARGSPPVWGPHYQGIERDLSTRALDEVCALQWTHCVKAATRDLESMSTDRRIVVRYEDLVTDPNEVLKHLFDFIELQWASETEADRMVRRIDDSRIGHGLRILEPEVLKRLEPIMEGQLRKYGYLA